MRYFEIAPKAGSSFRLPPTHPVLLELSIECERWPRFERLADDHPDIRILWNGTRDQQRMTIHVACVSEERLFLGSGVVRLGRGSGAEEVWREGKGGSS